MRLIAIIILKEGKISLYSFLIIAIISLIILLYVVFYLSIVLVPYLIIDHEEIGVLDSMKLSIRMMKGNKIRFFILQISFIGWAILCFPTFGIGALWLGPYIFMSQTNFYKSINENKN